MAPPIRKTNFVPEWIDLKPRIPVPRIDWIDRKFLDISYGDDPLQRYDLYRPNQVAQREKIPLVIVVHGGGFTHMDKRDWHMYPGFYALRENFALACVNYRLAPKNPYPDGLNDVKNAIIHIKENADAYGIDANHIFVYGTSAGGNFVSIIGLQGRRDNAGYAVRGVAALCPLISFDWIWQSVRRRPVFSLMRFACVYITRQYLGDAPARIHEKLLDAGAVSYVGGGCDIPPFYLQIGDKDPIIPTEQVTRLHDLLLAAGADKKDIRLDILRGARHAGGGPDFLEERNILPILRFFRQYL
jgi:acetyl esterase/lipase